MSIEVGNQSDKLSRIKIGIEEYDVIYQETSSVKEGVTCDTYNFVGDNSRDLAIVTVKSGHRTPKQRVLTGYTTQEGHYSGNGRLIVNSGRNDETQYDFYGDIINDPILVDIGKTMQWLAIDTSDLVFYEVCSPPYTEGRFQNLSD